MTILRDGQGPGVSDRVLGVLSEYLGAGTDSDLPDDVRFLIGVARILKKRILRGERYGEAQLPAIFLMHANPPSEIPGRRTKKVRMLDRGIEPVTGRVWFLNHSANNGLAVEIGPEDDEEEVFEWISTEILVGSVPAVVFDPRIPETEARYFPKGIDDAASCRTVQVGLQDVSAVAVTDAIENLYQQMLKTPEAQHSVGVDVWENAGKLWAKEDAERQIQNVLTIGLAGRFAGCVVNTEHQLPEGRFDIYIDEHVPGEATLRSHMILELKVLRARGKRGRSISANAINAWVRKGTEQAWSYAKAKNSAGAMLCCFDMRADVIGDSCFDHVRENADRLSVKLRVWHIFSSSSEWRAYEAERTLAG